MPRRWAKLDSSRLGALRGGSGLAELARRDYICGMNLTERAIEKVKEIQDAEDLKEQGLRVRVIGGGCAGFQYDLYFEDEVSEYDIKFEVSGIPIYVDMMSHMYVEGTEIDYVEGLHGAGFKFQNPGAGSTCGCGTSFNV